MITSTPKKSVSIHLSGNIKETAPKKITPSMMPSVLQQTSDRSPKKKTGTTEETAPKKITPSMKPSVLQQTSDRSLKKTRGTY